MSTYQSAEAAIDQILVSLSPSAEQMPKSTDSTQKLLRFSLMDYEDGDNREEHTSIAVMETSRLV